ncbi:MAG: double-strand break repair helicase AddA [Pseudomonadota bacterium]|nr:double-strand break repair helicase AddA [Pseudomonadota bacterium]
MTDPAPQHTGDRPGGFVSIEAQTIAAAPLASVWVSASAGSGKTKVLADRVLRLLLNGSPAGKILCLTFTRAAAAEMQNRIRRLLGDWAVMSDAELDAAIVRLSGDTPTSEIRALARRLFAEVLDTPGGLKIQTIHAFCESLLGRFPVEAGLAPYFHVMDERTAAEALLTARNEILDAARSGADDALADALGVVTGWVHEDEFADLMMAIASNRSRLNRLLIGHGGIEGATQATRSVLGVAAEETVEALLQAAAVEPKIDQSGLRDAADVLSRGGKQDKDKAAKMSAWLFADPAARAKEFDAYASVYLTGSGTTRGILASKGAVKELPKIADIMQREAGRVFAVQEKRKAIQTAGATEAILAIATALINRYEDHKNRHAILDYDDLILRARRLVEQAAPWVLFKLDGGLDHILIDEAQDSNADQWAVVRAIVDEFHAGGGAREVGRTVFAVGDEKQSIFSFQGAAPDQFSAMSDYFEKRVTAAGQDWHRVPLDVSFRSTSTVLQAVDAVFADDEVREGVSSAKIVHKAHRHGQAGLVELWPPVFPEDRDDISPWSTPEDLRNDATPARRLAHAIAWRISDWVEGGEKLPSADRYMRPGDIMVLVRRRTEFVDNLIRELKKRRVDVAGLDRMVLTDQLAVQDLIALAAFALLPHDDLNLAAVLKGPLIGFDEVKLFEVCHRRDGTVWGSLRRLARTDPRCAEAHRILSDVLARADFAAPYEFFANILGPMTGRARLISRLSEEANDPIDEFLSLALAFEQTHTPSLQGFIRWLEEGDAQIKRDLDQGLRDEVRIMTVHGAKGLQAPVVILADTMQVPQSDGCLMWYHGDSQADALLWPPRSRVRERSAQRLAGEQRTRQDEEYRRLLYVAMTRAEDRLYIAGYGTRRTPPDAAWWNVIARGLEPVAEKFAFESHPGRPDDEAEMAWQGDGFRLQMPQTLAPDRRSEGGESATDIPELPGWIDAMAPEEPEPPRPLTPSRPTLPEPTTRSPLGDDNGLAFQRGVLVHRLLQTLPNLREPDRSGAARAFLARPVHGLELDQIDALVAETLAVLGDTACAPLFGPGSRAEVPVAGVVRGSAISGRIDRLVVGSGGVQILDFKTNRLPPSRPEDVPTLYLRQMSAYRALLRKIYKNQEVDCILLWTDGPRLMPLDAKLLDAYEP